MAAIIPLDRIRERWVRRAGQAAPDYEAGVTQTTKDWAALTAAAGPNYRTAVTAAAAEGRFERGVQRAGTPKWRQGAVVKGVPRFGPGVAAAADDFSRGFQPFRQAIESLTLPPRRPRRDPGNLERVRAVVNAMIATARAQEGARGA